MLHDRLFTWFYFPTKSSKGFRKRNCNGFSSKVPCEIITVSTCVYIQWYYPKCSLNPWGLLCMPKVYLNFFFLNLLNYFFTVFKPVLCLMANSLPLLPLRHTATFCGTTNNDGMFCLFLKSAEMCIMLMWRTCCLLHALVDYIDYICQQFTDMCITSLLYSTTNVH